MVKLFQTQGMPRKDEMMNNSMNNALALAGRILMAWLFIPAGFGKIAGFSGSVGYATAMGMPLPEIGVAVGLLIELVGGIFLLIGLKTRPAAMVLAFFTVVATLIFHAYWSVPADQAMMQQLLFNKNIAVVGGLLAFAAWGAGGWSVDANRRRI